MSYYVISYYIGARRGDRRVQGRRADEAHRQRSGGARRATTTTATTTTTTITTTTNNNNDDDNKELAEREKFGVVKNLVGHGIGEFFHGVPQVFHCRNSDNRKMAEGTTFTIEPVLTEGAPDWITWDDGWTNATRDGSIYIYIYDIHTYIYIYTYVCV